MANPETINRWDLELRLAGLRDIDLGPVDDGAVEAVGRALQEYRLNRGRSAALRLGADVTVPFDADKHTDLLFLELGELELTIRTWHSLGGKWGDPPLRLTGDIALQSETALLARRNFGRKSLQEVKEILRDRGLSLNMSYPWTSLLSEHVTQLAATIFRLQKKT